MRRVSSRLRPALVAAAGIAGIMAAVLIYVFPRGPSFIEYLALYIAVIGVTTAGLIAALEIKIPVKPKPRRPPVAKKPVSLKRFLPRITFAYRVSDRTKVLGYVAATLLAAFILLWTTFLYPGYEARPLYDNFLIQGLIIALIPPSFLDYVDRRYKKLVDAKLPDFLKNIAEAQRTGMAFVKALENAARVEYGMLTKELRKMMAKLTWGVPYNEALTLFARSVDTPLSHRAAVLLNEVGHSGGRMYEILDAVYAHVREVQELDKERRRQISPYVLVIYAAFGVFLFTVYILFTTFFSQVQTLVETGAPFGANINPSVYYIWFYHMSTIEAVLAGFVAGKMGEGASAAGFKHVLLLLTISVAAFSTFIKI